MIEARIQTKPYFGISDTAGKVKCKYGSGLQLNQKGDEDKCGKETG